MPILTIRDPQMAAFQAEKDLAFAEWAAGYLREYMSDAVAGLDQAEVRARALSGLARARGHGIEDSGTAFAFLRLMFRHAPNFDEYPAFREILKGTTPGAIKLDAILLTATPSDWREVAARKDARAWGDEGTCPTNIRP